MSTGIHSDANNCATVQAALPVHPPDVTLTADWPQALRDLTLDRRQRSSLVVQLVEAIAARVDSGALRAGDKLPSVRCVARALGISTFTAVEAYDRLAATSRVTARRGAGYFITCTRKVPAHTPTAPPRARPLDAMAPELYAADPATLPVGSGWLPSDWHSMQWLQDMTRQATRQPPQRLQGYGHAMGLPALRQLMCQRLAADGLLEVDPEQLLLTRSATHAFDLVLRTLVRPGDTVVMESPGYPPLAALIDEHGCACLTVARTSEGLDLDGLAATAVAHAPRLVFIQSVLHNPLGTTLSAAQLHRLLALAEQHDFYLIDDDVCRDLAHHGAPSLASLDGLHRVIRIHSTSKTLSPQWRVGSLAAAPELVREFARVKMLSGLTSSELEERIVRHAMVSSEYRRASVRLRTRLEAGVDKGVDTLRRMGLQPLALPHGGFFITAAWPGPGADGLSGTAIASRALRDGLLLAPGRLFLRDGDPPWFRFNVAWLEHPRLREFFRALELPGALS